MSVGRTAARSIGAELRAASRDSPDAVSLLHDGTATTYAQQFDEVRRVACALIDRGLRLGDRIVVWAGNDRTTAMAMLAVAAAGGTVVPLNTRYTPHEAAYIVERTSPRLIMAPNELLGRHLAAEAVDLAGTAPVVSLGEPTPPGTVAWADFQDGPGPSTAAEFDRRLDSMTGDEVVITQFTSGTTGKPKGALLRQGPLLSTSQTWVRISGLGAGDVYPILYPLAHVGGFKTGLVSTLIARASVILVPVVNADSVVDALSRHRVTFFNGPPAVLRTLLDAVRAGRLSADTRIRTVVSGSAVVPPALVRDLTATLGVEDVVIGYGLTEASGVCIMTRRGDPVDLVCSTLGRAIDGVDVRAVGASPDDPRAIEVRGASVMAGYLDDPGATATAVRDGWLDTGDTGWIGDDGYVRLAGRSTDMVIVGGFNVYPTEVENALLEHAAVRQAAVVGIEDSRLGEVPVAFVVTDDTPLTPDVPPGDLPDELIAWCRGRLANFKVPRRVWVVEEFPRGHVGKVARAALVRQAADLVGAERTPSTSALPHAPPAQTP